MLFAIVPAHAACPPRVTPDTHVWANGLCLAVETFGTESAGDAPTLVVVVHGDISDGGRATYHAAFAREIARPGVVAVAITRPGYTNAEGRTSEGETLGRDDNYTGGVIAATGSAIVVLKAHHRARRVIYVGHSGGAAIGGGLIGLRPGLVDAALLISCPCDIAAWRKARGLPEWTRSLSPSTFVSRVPAATRVTAMTGVRDENTFPWLAENYVTALARRAVAADFVPVADAGHGFAGLKDAAAEAVASMLARP